MPTGLAYNQLHEPNPDCFQDYHSEILCDEAELELTCCRSVQRNVMELSGNGSVPNCKPDLYQFYKSSPKHVIHTGLIHWSDTVLMLLRYWYSSENIPVTELFVNRTVSVQKIFGCDRDYPYPEEVGKKKSNLGGGQRKLAGSFVMTHWSWSQPDPQAKLNGIAGNTGCRLNWLRNEI